MTLSATDYALLSQDSYKTRENNSKVELGGVSYRVMDHMNDPVTGYQGTAYQRLDTGEVVIAHRGTEQVIRDGVITDGGMVLTGLNLQMGDAVAFTKRVMDEAKSDAAKGHYTADVTVTGHSLGGTLAEATAYKFGLHGQTFNAYGAAGLLEGIPKGGNQVIDNVRATDVVSAASAHFGEVRTFAVQQDIDKLTKDGYRDNSTAFSLRNPIAVAATSLSAHAIDNFVPNGKTLGQSIMSPENEARYEAHKGMIDRYRTDVMDARTVISAGWEIPRAVVHGAESLEHAAAQKLAQTYDALHKTAENIGHKVSEVAHHTVDRIEHAVDAARKTVTDDLSKGAHFVEQTAQKVGHDAVQAFDAAKHAIGEKLHEASEALDAARKNVSDKASQVFDTLRHPSHLFENNTPGKPTAQLDQAAHPDHAMFNQALQGVHRLDAAHSRTPDQGSSNLAGALVVAAKQDGMSQINHVALSDDGSRAFAVQGDLNSPFKQIADVHTQQAMATPLDKSTQSLQQIDQHQRAQASQHEQTQQQNPSMRMT
ncbi:XVIPCD domain-containing protein [Dyella sp. GSA-30]|uniref:XVIPCD domain-containing protein n=1 Tax=Dyella sp. GSA-30 TaxID=2994496 RepID=UPI00249385D6|nr:XVIPCD domain-containing protein [Dyella sp. GSA-30]BDU18550.1 hypothetical protein DYGSA30_00070 [Dyella sp. GSA-30]